MIGRRIKLNWDVGEIIDKNGTYVLVKFEYGQFVLNSSSFKEEFFLDKKKVQQVEKMQK